MDIIFISYDEPNADENFRILQQYRPYAKRVHGIRGIREAHIAAANHAITSSFFVVDGDVQVLPNCAEVFDYEPPKWDKKYVHIWSSTNEVTGDSYGNGGIKMFSKKMFTNVSEKPYTDFSMGCGEGIKIMTTDVPCAVTKFNSTQFHAWRGAFRECAKLSFQFKSNQDMLTYNRLSRWIRIDPSKNIPFVKDVIQGAITGTVIGTQMDDISSINDEAAVVALYNKLLIAQERYDQE